MSLNKLSNFLFKPIDIASLIYFRLAFGGIMLWEVWRYMSMGRIERYWLEPSYHFTYYGFGWVQPWPGNGMHWHFIVMGILSIFIILGLCYRLSACLFFLAFTYMFLLEQAQYLNHFYLVCLISFIMIFMPAHHALSLDSLLNPQLKSDTVPAWTLWWLRLQLGLVYFYAGLAKLHSDWLQGEPMRMWLGNRTDYPYLGPFFTEEWIIYLFSYGGLLFDLFVFPLLLWPRSRPFAFLVALSFHLMNTWLFSIGIFPWFMIAATALFFSPDWPRRWVDWFSENLKDNSSLPTPPEGVETAFPEAFRPASRHVILGLLGLYLVIQILFPFRHHLYPGDVHWTEEGHRFSWRMKLRSKQAVIHFFITNPQTNQRHEVYLPDYLTDRQIRKMSTRPDMILQFSHYLAEEMKKQGYEPVMVQASTMTSLNGREFQPMIDTSVDLAAQPRGLNPKPWILPLTEPLKQTELVNRE